MFNNRKAFSLVQNKFNNNNHNLKILLMFFVLFTSTVNAENYAWKYSEYDYPAWVTAESGYIYEGGEAALNKLGETHWSGLHFNSTYHFTSLFGFKCNANLTSCRSRATYQRCYLSEGTSPSTSGLWRSSKFDHFGWTVEESGYTFSDGASALESLGNAYWSGVHGNSEYRFLTLVNLKCSGRSCTARPQYERCYIEDGNCNVVTPLVSMHALSGTCDSSTPLSFMYALRGNKPLPPPSPTPDLGKNIGSPLDCPSPFVGGKD